LRDHVEFHVGAIQEYHPAEKFDRAILAWSL
jgi:hypothetical protein